MYNKNTEIGVNRHRNSIFEDYASIVRKLHGLMCDVLSSSIPLDFADVSTNKVVFKYKDTATDEVLKRFLDFWITLLRSNNITAKISEDKHSLGVFTSYDKLQEVVVKVVQKEEMLRNGEKKNVDDSFSVMRERKYFLPEKKDEQTSAESNKKFQEDADAKLAALLQWQELHPDKKGVVKTFDQTELDQLKNDIEKEYSKCKP